MGVRRLIAVARQCGRVQHIQDLAGAAIGVDISVWCESLLNHIHALANANLHSCFRIYRAASALTLDELRDVDRRAGPRYVGHAGIA